MFANYHTHTARCGHAGGTDREYVESAIENGFRILGFSDHTPFPDRAHSGMHPDQLADYAQSVLSLKEEYREKVQLYLGVEAEFDPKSFHKLVALLKEHSVEYLILGQHVVFGVPGDPGCYGGSDDEKLLDVHCGLCRDAIDTGFFTYVAHADFFNFTGDSAVYEKKIRPLCRFAKERNVPLEINLLGIRTHRHYPNPLFWKIAGEEGCDTILGVDAHHPKDFGNTKAIQIAEKIVKANNLHLLDTVNLRPLK